MHTISENTCLLYLIRHGATESNLATPPRLQGRGVNLPLSAEGRRQAEKTAAYLARAGISAVYTSPLLRAVETAKWIAHPHDLEAQEIAALVEVDVGRWEGRSWEEISQTEAEAYQCFQTDPGRYPYAGGENMQQVFDRVAPAIEELLVQNVGRTVAVVGHNVVNRAYLAGVLGLPIAKSRNIIQDNCGVNLLSWRNGETKLITCNAVGHL